jgi:outer membrane protein
MPRTVISGSIIPLLAFVLLAVSPSTLFAQRELPLEEIRALVHANAEEIAIARLGTEHAARGVDIVRAQRLPRVDLGASYTHVSETAGIDIAVPGMFSRTISLGDGNFHEVALSASVPLFTGFRLKATQDVFESQREIAGMELRSTEVSLHNQVTTAYLHAQLARRTIAIFDGQLRYLTAQLDILKKLEAQGQLLPYDTLLLSTRISALRVERASATTGYRNALLRIADMAAIEEEFDVVAALQPETALPVSDMPALERLAIERRSDLAVLRQLQTAGAARVRAENASLLPSVSAFASLRYGKPGVDQFANAWMHYYTAGLALQWNLWSWGGDRGRIEQQELALRETDLRLERLRRQVRRSILALLNELSVLRETGTMLDEQLRQERAKRELLQARFDQGLATATELVDAETTHTTALLRREQNDIQYRLKLTELANAIGVDS